MCVCVCGLSNIVTLVYAASVCLQLSHCDRKRMREVEYGGSDNTKAERGREVKSEGRARRK